MTHTISNMDDTLDSRDIIERIEELENSPDDFSEEDGQELAALLALQEEAEDYCPDWTYGAQLIRDSYFEQAMDEMIADCYTLPEIPIFMTITLDYAALRSDYTSVDFDGVTYWVR